MAGLFFHKTGKNPKSYINGKGIDQPVEGSVDFNNGTEGIEDFPDRPF